MTSARSKHRLKHASSNARRLAAVLVSALTIGSSAWAQTDTSPTATGEVSAVRGHYEYGQFAQVEPLAQGLLDRGDLAPAQLLEVHLYAGLAAFNLGKPALAERHFTALLRNDPDYALDPFLAPPPALRLFDALRTRLAPELEQLREARAATAAEISGRAREVAREAAEKEALQRARMDAQARAASVRQLGQGAIWVSVLPFGAGQFQQGRIGAGIAFAASETILAAASLLTFFLYNNLFQTVTLPVGNQTLGGNGQIQISGIPRNLQQRAEVLHAINLGSTIGTYAVYAGGVTEAFLRYHELESSASVSVEPQGAGIRVSVRF